MQAKVVVLLILATAIAFTILAVRMIRFENERSLDRQCPQLVTIYDNNHVGTEVRMGEAKIRPEKGSPGDAAAEIKRLHPECIGHL